MSKISYIIFILFGCNTYEGKTGISQSVEDSKNRKVFINEFLRDTLIGINDTFQLSIKRGWVEHKWQYEFNYQKSKKRYGEQLILNIDTNKTSLQYFSRDWSIQAKSLKLSEGFGKLNDNSIYIFDPYNYNELTFYIVTGWEKIHDSLELRKRLIGKFRLSKPPH